MKQGILIIFVKNPVRGKVKTRIGKDLGDDKALEVYRALLQYTKQITRDLPVKKAVYYSHFIDFDDMWEEGDYYKYLQLGAHLGERMAGAFKQSFSREEGPVVIIGSDCHELSDEIICEAFNLLKHSDAVIGPAKDGGYYLGMKNYIPELFVGKRWSSPSVAPDTIKDLEKLYYSYALLPELRDIDTVEDLYANQGNLEGVSL